MSNSHHPRSMSSIPPPNDLASIAAMLQEAAHALQRYCEENPPQPTETRTSLSGGETRCYYFSPATLRQERKLLHKYRTNDFRGLLEEAHFLLAGIVKLMRSTDSDARFHGNVVSSLGALLERVSILILRMRNVYEHVERIHP